MYRKGVGICLINKENLVFVAQRIDTKGEAWQMPQGGIDEGETPREAILRELWEETGIEQKHVYILQESQEWLSYDLPEDLQKTLWGGGYKGQKQKWFLARFLGVDEDIHLTHSMTPEFSSWAWVAREKISDLIVPFKKQLYQDILAAFQNYF